MRLLQVDENGEFSLTDDLVNRSIYTTYSILSHTWGHDHEEVNFRDLTAGPRMTKPGFRKLRFCAEQASRDSIPYFWVDTCCIDKSNSVELQEAINSMFRWYRHARKCYVYLVDVSTNEHDQLDPSLRSWIPAFRKSRWFTRGWTLQELLAPSSVEFFCSKGNRLGDKRSLAQEIHGITGIPIQALEGAPLSEFSIDERISWAKMRQTKREEDIAYSLLGIFDTYMPLIYGEGAANALSRLQKEIERSLRHPAAANGHAHLPYTIVPQSSFETLSSTRIVNRLVTRQHSSGSTNVLNAAHPLQGSTCSEASTDSILLTPIWDSQLSTSLTNTTNISLSSSDAPISNSLENGIKVIVRIEVDNRGDHQEIMEMNECDAFQAVYEEIIRIRNKIIGTASSEPVLYHGTLTGSSISVSGAEDHTFPFNSTFLRAVLEQFKDKYYTSVAIWARFSTATPDPTQRTVQQELFAELEAAKVSGVDGTFISLNCIKEILTVDRIQQLLLESCDHYNVLSQLLEVTDWVSQYATRLLATMILANIENSVSKFMNFVENGFSDSSMPLDCSKLPFFCRRLDYDLICATQPQTLVADFSPSLNDLSIRTFDFGYRLPFIERSLIETGGYSDVYQIKIHSNHLYGPKEDPDRGCFAIKQLHSPSEEPFRREYDVLCRLSLLNPHPHLINLLAAFKYCGKYHLMFPLASGSLRSFLIRYDPRRDRTLIPWVWRQLAGIADGLHYFHTLPEEQADMNVPSLEREIRTSRDYGAVRWRHHDLKPGNILWFPKLGKGKGTLKISDFGSSEFNRGFNSVPRTPGTWAYSPPECDLRSPELESGPSYDIWSFGAILSEIVAWILGGPGELEAFRAERKGYIIRRRTLAKLAAPFYYYERGKFNISLAVKRRLEVMTERAVEIFGQEAGEEVADQIANLIKACLFIDSCQRPTACAVSDHLNTISRSLEVMLDSDTQNLESRVIDT